jgi:hypothetical protein
MDKLRLSATDSVTEIVHELFADVGLALAVGAVKSIQT